MEQFRRGDAADAGRDRPQVLLGGADRTDDLGLNALEILGIDAAGERVGGADYDWSDRSGWGSASVLARYDYGAAGLPWAVGSVANVVTLPSGPIFLTRGSHCSRLAEWGCWYSKT